MQKSITQDPELMHGTPVFRGTLVPVQTFFDYIENGESLDDFLEDFPTIAGSLQDRSWRNAKNSGWREPEEQRAPLDKFREQDCAATSTNTTSTSTATSGSTRVL
jgi:hypothetical protein